MICQFQAPGSGRIVEAQAVMSRSDSVKSRLIDTVKRNVLSEMRNVAHQMVRQALGGGAAGRIGSTAVSSALSGTHSGAAAFSSEDKERAILEAFQSVAQFFVFDPETKEWRDAEAMSPMEGQLLRHPVTDAFEKDLLTRMLVQMAAADEDLSVEERDFLFEQLGLSPLQTDRLSLAAHPVLAAECASVSPPVAETMYLLLFAIAVADHELKAEERKLLDRYGEMLRLPLARVEKLSEIARVHFLENALRTGSSWEDMLELGKCLGMEQEEMERAWVAHRRKSLK